MNFQDKEMGLSVCPICKKRFYRYSPSWAWQSQGNIFFCSYKCARIFDRRHDELIQKNKEIMKAREYHNNGGIKIVVDDVTYPSIREASASVGISEGGLRRAILLGMNVFQGHSIHKVELEGGY